MLDNEIEKTLLTAQRNEITEHLIYEKLSKSINEPHNKDVLKIISNDELKHYNFWKKYTNIDIKPDKLKIWKYFLISKIFGLTFGIKLMERGEEKALLTYEEISKFIPDARSIIRDEDEHEKQLIGLIDEGRLRYIGSMILGLNDALVELTGTLAGLTLTLQNAQVVAMVGLITGISASLSMAASEYLSTKSEEDVKKPLKASIYTGSAYVLTVLFLILPYLFFSNLYLCLGSTILNAIIVIFAFTFYISVVKDISFKKRFFEMILISLGIAALTFIVGSLIRIFLNVEI
ncbi:MAG: VIT1/CCC1 transporter family protein [Candidatus Bathyarchaeia archaeon]